MHAFRPRHSYRLRLERDADGYRHKMDRRDYPFLTACYLAEFEFAPDLLFSLFKNSSMQV